MSRLADIYDRLIDKLPDDELRQEPCLKNILCDCERRHCPGRTLSIKYYARKLKES